MAKTTFVVRLDPALLEQVDAVAKTRKLSRNAWIERVIQRGLDGERVAQEAAARAVAAAPEQRRPSPTTCPHPINRRVGHTCGACLKTL